REVGEDTYSFAEALRHVLRQDPDVILVGEMRDLETISTALTAAETGHLVFATLHTQDAPQSVDRVIDVFPAHQQQQIRVQLAASLQGIVTQQLLPKRGGGGRCVAAEVLIATPAVKNLIREGKTHQIYSSMQAGGKFGMQTMDQSLATLLQRGVIDLGVALERCANEEDLRRLSNGAKALAQVIDVVRQDVERGSSLSQALGRHPKVFNRLYVAMVRAGETGGVLDSVLMQVASTIEKQVELRRKIRSAMTYPTVVFFLCILIVVAMLLFIVPTFKNLYAQLNGTLPLM